MKITELNATDAGRPNANCFQCKFCKTKFANIKHLKQHMTSGKVLLTYGLEVVQNLNNMRSADCDQTYSTPEELNNNDNGENMTTDAATIDLTRDLSDDEQPEKMNDKRLTTAVNSENETLEGHEPSYNESTVSSARLDCSQKIQSNPRSIDNPGAKERRKMVVLVTTKIESSMVQENVQNEGLGSISTAALVKVEDPMEDNTNLEMKNGKETTKVKNKRRIEVTNNSKEPREKRIGVSFPIVEANGIANDVPQTISNVQQLIRNQPEAPPANAVAAYFSHIDKPDRFYINLASNVEALKKRQQELQSFASFLPKLTAFGAGMNCIAHNSQNNELCRARVIIANNVRASVKFIDYGNLEEIDCELLKMVDDSYFAIEPFALSFALAVKPINQFVGWTTAACQMLQSLSEKLLYCKQITSSLKCTYVNLYCDGRDLTKDLIEKNLATKLQIEPERHKVMQLNNGNQPNADATPSGTCKKYERQTSLRSKSFARRFGFSRKKHSSHSAAKFQCNYEACQNGYNKLLELVRHKRIVHNSEEKAGEEEWFKCDSCLEQYTEMYSLLRHKCHHNKSTCVKHSNA